ncbi:hypothetical protein [Streptomyces sp. NPDC001933]|uniref:hypothetical protein n=1 Tax=Streptomyces sp. NPDC001933 TaxID=3364626 RepID=UPI003681E606
MTSTLPHPPGTGTPKSRPTITWLDYVNAVRTMRADGRSMARLIADTLTTQYPTAAYLVLEEDDDSDILGLHSILDADGRLLYALGDDHACFPNLPPHSPLAQAWAPLNPADPWTLFKAIQWLHQTGFLFDQVPEDDLDDDAPAEMTCLLLSTAARPAWWDRTDDVNDRVLRPYSAPNPHQANEDS